MGGRNYIEPGLPLPWANGGQNLYGLRPSFPRGRGRGKGAGGRNDIKSGLPFHMRGGRGDGGSRNDIGSGLPSPRGGEGYTGAASFLSIAGLSLCEKKVLFYSDVWDKIISAKIISVGL